MYRDKLEAMTKKELLEESVKFLDNAGVKQSDTKDVMIEKLVLADLQKPGLTEAIKTGAVKVVTSPYEDTVIDRKIIGTEEAVSEEELLTPYEKAERQLVENYERSQVPLKATLSSYMTLAGDDGKLMFVIQASYGPTFRQILVPFEEYKLDVRSVVVKKAASENAQRTNEKACRNVKAEDMNENEIRTYINKRFLSHLHFVVTELDEEEGGYVIGSRVKAAKYRQREWYKRVKIGDNAGDWYLRDGKIVRAEIVAVETYGIYVEVFGYEFFVPKVELEFVQRVDCKAIYRPGQRINLLLKNVKRDEKGNFVSAALSAVDLVEGETPAQRLAASLDTSGNQVVFGSVVDIEYTRKQGYRYYVMYGNALQIACRRDSKLRININVGDTVAVKIDDVQLETGQARGFIQHVYPSFDDAADPIRWDEV